MKISPNILLFTFVFPVFYYPLPIKILEPYHPHAFFPNLLLIQPPIKPTTLKMQKQDLHNRDKMWHLSFRVKVASFIISLPSFILIQGFCLSMVLAFLTNWKSESFTNLPISSSLELELDVYSRCLASYMGTKINKYIFS